MDVTDVVAAVLGAVATVGLFAGFDVVSGGGIDWLLDGALAVGVGATVLYVRATADGEAIS